MNLVLLVFYFLVLLISSKIRPGTHSSPKTHPPSSKVNLSGQRSTKTPQVPKTVEEAHFKEEEEVIPTACEEEKVIRVNVDQMQIQEHSVTSTPTCPKVPMITAKATNSAVI